MKEILFGTTSCIVLAAGSSERLGTPKALLHFTTKKTFIEKITETYVKCGIQQVIVVVNNAMYRSIQDQQICLAPEVQLVINPFPGKGRFYSLQTGVDKLKPGNYCFFQNIDNPFTSAEVLKSLIQNKNEADVIIPVFKSKSGHPVLISPAVARKISSISDSQIRIDTFLKTFATKNIEIADGRILININTPEDLAEAGFSGIR